MRKRVKCSGTIGTSEQKVLPLEQCLAKTYNGTHPGRVVLQHCQITGTIAKGLMNRMPSWLRKNLFPDGSQLVAACHDVGKISPTFQEKIYRGTQGYQNNSRPELKQINPELEKGWGGHAGVSQTTAKHLNLGKYIPKILGQHHGYSPNIQQEATDASFGGEPWQRR